MPIAELFLSAFLQVLFDRLASRELLNFARREGIDVLLKKWEEMLVSVNQVLDDAEDRQLNGDLGVNSWLKNLRDLACDIKDLLEEFAIESAKNKSEVELGTSKVRSLLPSCCFRLSPRELMFDHTMRSKMEEMDGKLKDIIVQKNILQLRENNGKRSAYGQVDPLHTTNLLDMHGISVEIIIECQEDMRNEKELSDLVICYFDCVQNILKFYSSLDDCQSQAHRNQWEIRDALTDFEEERGENVGGKKYVETLRKLMKFKEAANPFTDKFFTLLHSVNEQQAEMLQKLQSCKKKVAEKIKSAQACRRVTNAIFVTAFVATVILSVVAVAIGAPPVVIAVATALTAPIGTVGQWCYSRWKKYQRKLEKKRELINLMTAGSGTMISIKELETIQSLVSKLETGIESIVQNADFALGEEQEEAVKRGVLEIKKRVKDVMADIDVLCKQGDKSRRDIEWARKVIEHKLNAYSNH